MAPHPPPINTPPPHSSFRFSSPPQNPRTRSWLRRRLVRAAVLVAVPVRGAAGNLVHSVRRVPRRGESRHGGVPALHLAGRSFPPRPRASDLGSHPTIEIEPTPATAKYTKFLLDTARGHVEAVKVADKFATPYEKTKLSPYTIGAMTSCFCLYVHLGQELEMFLRDGEEGHAYKEWVDTLASTSFQASAVQLEELLDKLILASTIEEHKVTEEIYRQALKLQIDFLSSQPLVQQTAFPLTRLYDPADGLVIFSGFDLTCTVRDSAILAEVTIQMARKAGDIEDHNSIAQKSLAMKNSWQAIQREYTEEYNKLIESAPRVGPLNYDAVYNGLEEISNFEKWANMKVFKSGLLRGISLNEMSLKVLVSVWSSKMVVLIFFQTVVKKKNELNAEIHIISYCWCSDLMRSQPVGNLAEVTIHSNDFFYEKDVSTGVYTSSI